MFSIADDSHGTFACTGVHNKVSTKSDKKDGRSLPFKSSLLWVGERCVVG